MKVGSDKKTNGENDETEELSAIIRRNAAGEIVGNFLIEDDNGPTDGHNNEAKKEPAEAKIPIHEFIIRLIFRKR